MPKALIINPAHSHPRKLMGIFASVLQPFPALGVAYIASAFEAEGWQVKVIDQFATKDTAEGIARQAANFKADFVGLSVLSTSARDSIAISTEIRKVLPKAIIGVGNIHTDYYGPRWLERGHCDIVFFKEGDISAREFARVYDRKSEWGGIGGIAYLENGQVVTTPDRVQLTGKELEELALPNWDLHPMEHYRAPFVRLQPGRDVFIFVQASRGCPYKCDYCSQVRMSPKLRKRSMVNLIDEIEYSKDKFGINSFFFADAIFPLSKKDGLEFCDEFERRGLHKTMRWGTETRVDFVDDELIGRMKRAGLANVFYGIEIADQAVLDATNKKQNQETAREAVAACKRHGVSCFGGFIHGLPGETRETILATRRFAKDIDPHFAKFNLAVPYPGSPFFDRMMDKISEEDTERLTSWFSPEDKDVTLLWVPKGMTPQQLKREQMISMLSFYLRPHKIFAFMRYKPISIIQWFLIAWDTFMHNMSSSQTAEK